MTDILDEAAPRDFSALMAYRDRAAEGVFAGIHYGKGACPQRTILRREWERDRSTCTADEMRTRWAGRRSGEARDGGQNG